MKAATEATQNGIEDFSLSHYRCETSPVAAWFHGRALRYGSEARLTRQVHKPILHCSAAFRSAKASAAPRTNNTQNPQWVGDSIGVHIAVIEPTQGGMRNGC